MNTSLGQRPRFRQKTFTSADSAIHLRVFFGKYAVEFDERYVTEANASLIRAFSARFRGNFSSPRPFVCTNSAQISV
jgi:hypothetical protein